MLGFFELLLISLITLLIVRPERLPTIVKKVVYFVKKNSQIYRQDKDIN